LVHQNHEDEKNSSEFFEANAVAPKSVRIVLQAFLQSRKINTKFLL